MSIPRMDTVARQLRLIAGGDTFAQGEGAGTTLETLRNYLKPDALAHLYQQMAKFLLRRRTDQATVRYLLAFDVLRRKAEARVIMHAECGLLARRKIASSGQCPRVSGAPHCGYTDASII